MKFKLGNAEFEIRFEHTNIPEEDERNSAAFLYASPSHKDSPYLAVGAGYCHPRDNFCRAVGRRVALTRLIKEMKDKSFILSKEDSRIIWDIYFKTFKKGKLHA
jgi:hypothetical protein